MYNRINITLGGNVFMTQKQKATLDDIAKLANVSKTAVSMILNEKEGVSFLNETVERVFEAANRLGYAKKESRHNRNKVFNENTILVLSPSVTNPYYATLIQSIEQMAATKELRIIVINTFRDKSKELEAINMIKGSNLYGIISTMTPQCVAELEEINLKIPVAVISDKGNDFDLDTVEINNYSAGVLIAKHMIELGHKNVAYVSTTLDSVNNARIRRLDGIRDTYKNLCPQGKITVKSSNVSPEEELNDIDIEHSIGYELALEVLKIPEITGFIAVNDMVAYGVMDALLDKNYKIPRDYSICGFDNLFPSRFNNISLTSVEHHIINKGQNSVEMLINRHESSRSSYSSTKILYKHELIIRNSTSTPREIKAK